MCYTITLQPRVTAVIKVDTVQFTIALRVYYNFLLEFKSSCATFYLSTLNSVIILSEMLPWCQMEY